MAFYRPTTSEEKHEGFIEDWICDDLSRYENLALKYSNVGLLTPQSASNIKTVKIEANQLSLNQKIKPEDMRFMPGAYTIEYNKDYLLPRSQYLYILTDFIFLKNKKKISCFKKTRMEKPSNCWEGEAERRVFNYNIVNEFDKFEVELIVEYYSTDIPPSDPFGYHNNVFIGANVLCKANSTEPYNLEAYVTIVPGEFIESIPERDLF